MSLLLRIMADPFFNQDFHFGSWIGHSISHPNSWSSEAQFFLRDASFAAAKRQIPPTRYASAEYFVSAPRRDTRGDCDLLPVVYIAMCLLGSRRQMPGKSDYRTKADRWPETGFETISPQLNDHTDPTA
jgi:hypothetical protein